MRRERAARRDVVGRVRLGIDAADRSGHVVFDAEHVSFAYGGRPIVEDFSTRIARGDRIGLIGPNGAGKTTLLRLLTGELKPDRGTIERGTNLQIAYFDQQREQLDPERTVADAVADGNDTVVVHGQPRHVHGYLRDFLFPPERARSPVKALSGGERNRLLLARLFTRAANVLILDEPTNDLDLETLELLEEQLVEFPGTILLVSHDRTFLDHIVTSVFAFEGDGRIVEYVGGYEDWERQRTAAVPAPAETTAMATAVATAKPPRARTANPAKLSFKEKKELEELPARIDAIEAEIGAIEQKLASSDFYREPADTVRDTVARLETLRAEHDAALQRWEELDTRQTGAKTS
jgi:ATP-binding cassette subfamily F protein uup